MFFSLDYGSDFLFNFAYFIYKLLFLDKVLGFILYLSKLVYIYQTLETLLKPLMSGVELLRVLFNHFWMNGLSQGFFFNHVYKDLLHDFFFFWLEWTEITPFRDFFFARRYTMSYLYNWYVFIPTLLEMSNQL